MITQRQRVVDEIYTTEEFYITSLQYCKEYFYTNMKSEKYKSVIKGSVVDEIFDHFDEVLEVNTRFYMALRTLKERDQLETQIGKTFNTYIPFFRVYFLYISHFDQTNQILSEFEKDSDFNEMLAEIQKQVPSQTNLDLRSYLIMPVQRLPRYQLLLADLLKNTEESHCDYANIKAAVEGIKSVTMEVNEKTKDIDRKAKVLKVKPLISGLHDLQLIEPDRALLLEGTLTKVCKKMNKPRYFYLFNDVLIYGIGDKKISVSEWFYLKNVVVENDERYENGFIIKSDVKSFTVICDSLEQKKLWFETIKACALEQKERCLEAGEKLDPTVRAVWTQDSEVKECPICKAPFNLVNRRHHCRFCGNCVCSDCSKHRLLNKKLDVKERVCDVCYKLANGDLDFLTNPNQKLRTSLPNDSSKKLKKKKPKKPSKSEARLSADVGVLQGNAETLESLFGRSTTACQDTAPKNIFFDLVGEDNDDSGWSGHTPHPSRVATSITPTASGGVSELSSDAFPQMFEFGTSAFCSDESLSSSGRSSEQRVPLNIVVHSDSSLKDGQTELERNNELVSNGLTLLMDKYNLTRSMSPSQQPVRHHRQKRRYSCCETESYNNTSMSTMPDLPKTTQGNSNRESPIFGQPEAEPPRTPTVFVPEHKELAPGKNQCVSAEITDPNTGKVNGICREGPTAFIPTTGTVQWSTQPITEKVQQPSSKAVETIHSTKQTTSTPNTGDVAHLVLMNLCASQTLAPSSNVIHPSEAEQQGVQRPVASRRTTIISQTPLVVPQTPITRTERHTLISAGVNNKSPVDNAPCESSVQHKRQLFEERIQREMDNAMRDYLLRNSKK